MFNYLFEFLFVDNSFDKLLRTFNVNGQDYKYYDLNELNDERLGKMLTLQSASKSSHATRFPS